MRNAGAGPPGVPAPKARKSRNQSRNLDEKCLTTLYYGYALTMNETQIPHFDIEVQLTGNDGNAFAVMATVIRGMRKAGATPVQVADFQKEAMSGDYDNLLATAQRWVRCL